VGIGSHVDVVEDREVVGGTPKERGVVHWGTIKPREPRRPIDPVVPATVAEGIDESNTPPRCP
jgi:hypothetical protein